MLGEIVCQHTTNCCKFGVDGRLTPHNACAVREAFHGAQTPFHGIERHEVRLFMMTTKTCAAGALLVARVGDFDVYGFNIVYWTHGFLRLFLHRKQCWCLSANVLNAHCGSKMWQARSYQLFLPCSPQICKKRTLDATFFFSSYIAALHDTCFTTRPNRHPP